MKLSALFSVVFLITTFGCGHKYTCPKEYLSPVYISYSLPEIDTLILKRFKSGTNFSELVDSVLITYNNCTYFSQRDTISLFINREEYRFSNAFDWELTNPTDRKTVSISNMQFDLVETKSGGLFSMDPSPCSSPLVTYKRDGIAVANLHQGNNSLIIRR